MILSLAFALGLGLLGIAGAPAAPLSAGAIGNAARSDSVVHQVPCAMRRVCNRRGCWTRRVCW
jgi:hypothetical protein